MVKWIKYICLKIEEKYSVNCKTGLKVGSDCMWEKDGLPCICISGEALSQAVNGVLGFLKKPQYSVCLRVEEDSIFPIIMVHTNRGMEQYIGIYAKEKYCLQAKEVGRKYCDKNREGRVYLILEYHVNRTTKKFYNKEDYNKEELEPLKRELENEEFAEHYSREKYAFLIYLLTNIYIVEDRKRFHFVLDELMLFLQPDRMHEFLKVLLREGVSVKQADIVIEFLEKHIDFLLQLNKEAEEKGEWMSVFSTVFANCWGMNLSQVIAEYVTRNDRAEQEIALEKCVKMIFSSHKSALRRERLRNLRKEVGILREKYDEIYGDRLGLIEINMAKLEEVSAGRKNEKYGRKKKVS